MDFSVTGIINNICSILSAALMVSAGILYATDIYAQGKFQTGDISVSRQQENTLREDIEAYTTRALKDRVISQGKADSLRIFIMDSLPAIQEQRITILTEIRDEIDSLYDRFAYKSNEITSYDYEHLASSMLPSVLSAPDNAPDPYRQRRDAELAAIMNTREMAMMHFGQTKSKIPQWAIWPLRLLFNMGMDTSGKTIAVHGGLYYIPVPPGKPVEPSWAKTVPKAYDD